MSEKKDIREDLQQEYGDYAHAGVKAGSFVPISYRQSWGIENLNVFREETPMGLILCAGKSDEHVELLELSDSGIRVAEYLAELPPRELLEAKLKSAVERAHNAVRQ